MLARQGVGFVFRMALEEDQQAARLADEQVDAAFRRARQHAITFFGELRLVEVVPTRMRRAVARLEPADQLVIGDDVDGKDAGALVGERAARDAVAAQHLGVRGEAGQQRRDGVLGRPVEDEAELVPERLVAQVCGARLGAGDDERVELRAPRSRRRGRSLRPWRGALRQRAATSRARTG